jgi:alkyl hydroperoxide reductase subunit AhpC
VGVSIDHKPALVAWSESLGGITFPMLSDFWPHGKTAHDYGVFREAQGMSERAIFVIDTAGIVRYIDVHDIKEQPDEEQIFDVLATLK